MAPAPEASSPPAIKSTVRAVERRWRQDILALPPDSYLGSEDEVRARYGCSQATLRQAARLLEHKQLLVVRRGVGGGYYARRPNLDALVDAAALALHLRRTTWQEMLVAAQAVSTETVRLAAAAKRCNAHGRLERLAARLGAAVEPMSANVVLADERTLFECLMSMIDNGPLELFQRVLFTFGLNDANGRLYHDHPDRWPVWRRERKLLVEAILAGDPDMAVLLARRQNRLVREWLGDEPMARPMVVDEGVAS